MSNEAQAAAAATEAKVEVAETSNEDNKVVEVIPHDPVAVNTKWGAVAVYGHEYVSKKELQIFQRLLSVEAFDTLDHGVRAIILRADGRPHKDGKPMLATCDLDGGTVIVNLMQTVSTAIEWCIDNPKFSILAVAHQTMLENILHEAHHISGLGWDLGMRELLEKDEDGSFWASMEKEAEAFALEGLYELAKVADIEPGHIAESPFLAQQVMEIIASDETSEFAQSQRDMLENRQFFYQEGDDTHKAVILHTFKEFLHYASGDDLDDEAWLKPTVAVANGPVPSLLEQTAAPDETGEVEEVVEESVVIDTGDGAPVTETVTPAAAVAPVVTQVVEQAPVAQVVVGGEAGSEGFVGVDDIGEIDPDDGVFDAAEFADYCTEGPAGAPTPSPETVVQLAGAGGAGAATAVAAAQVAGIPAVAHTPEVTPVMENVAGVPEVQPAAHGLNDAQVGELVFGVYNKMFEHIFTHCGRPAGFPHNAEDCSIPITDIELNDGGPNCQLANVFLRPIQLTEAERKVIIRCSCRGADGKWSPVVDLQQNGGLLRGFTASGAKIPMYKVTVANADGTESLRLIMPQNPNKPGSKRALQAQGGTKIMYVVDGEDKEEEGKSSFLAKRINNDWSPC